MGRWGEALAALYLQGLGYQILARNLRNRLGELDLVALDGEILVFVEVRTRRGGPAGTPEESVDRAKQARLQRLASAFRARHPLHRSRPARIDVIALRLHREGLTLRHLRNVTG
ncbi:MAG: YraN family protein [Firmicutes bacterium]|nr:YraN family protein [Bacillota bacterium]